MLSRKTMARILTLKGRDAEKIAAEACLQLKGEGKILDFWDTGNMPDVDIVICTNDGNFIPIEIKSSWIGAEMHQLISKKIPVIVVNLRKVKPPKRLFRKKTRQAKNQI